MNRIDFSDTHVRVLYAVTGIAGLAAFFFTWAGHWFLAAALWALTAFCLSIPAMWLYHLSSTTPTRDEEEPTGLGLTEEQTEYYLNNHGLRCPFCGSDQLEADAITVGEIEPDDARQKVRCLDPGCKAKWIDEYKLCDVSVTHSPVNQDE